MPAEPADLFRDHEKALGKLFRQLPPGVRTRTETKRQLWLDMLRVSGIAPHDNNADRLFVTHSLLIAIAWLVAHGLTSQSGDWRAALDNGFVSWITDSELGRKWVDELRQTVEDHDWKRRRLDELTSVLQRGDRLVVSECALGAGARRRRHPRTAVHCGGRGQAVRSDAGSLVRCENGRTPGRSTAAHRYCSGSRSKVRNANNGR